MLPPFNSSLSAFATILGPYQMFIEEKIKENVLLWGPKTNLRDACEYALLNGGKRFRPALVMIIAKAIGKGIDVTQAALAIEYFHTASLIADDLPCMDNELARRNKPTVHTVFGETVALLASYALISAGYECLAKNTFDIKKNFPKNAAQVDESCVLALQATTFNTGILGACGGQFLDIYPSQLTKETILEVIHKKTVSLFEVAFVLGWLFGGGNIDSLILVKKAAGHFGLSFQIADDIEDIEQDLANGRLINYAAVVGVQEARSKLRKELELYQNTLAKLNLATTDLSRLAFFG